jgi:hypothetical protein
MPHPARASTRSRRCRPGRLGAVSRSPLTAVVWLAGSRVSHGCCLHRFGSGRAARGKARSTARTECRFAYHRNGGSGAAPRWSPRGMLRRRRRERSRGGAASWATTSASGTDMATAPNARLATPMRAVPCGGWVAHETRPRRTTRPPVSPAGRSLPMNSPSSSLLAVITNPFAAVERFCVRRVGGRLS